MVYQYIVTLMHKDGTIEPMFDSKPKGKYNKTRR